MRPQAFTETFCAAVTQRSATSASSARREAENLWRRWDSPGRGYHDALHLVEVLARLSDLEHTDDTCVLAAWFHDSVYTGNPGGDERASAELARSTLERLACDAKLTNKVGNLVLMTMNHQPSCDPHEQALADADLAILAAPPERYLRYLEGIRRDFSQIDEETFQVGRRRFVEGMLRREHVFCTSHGRTRWEHLARANLTAELRRTR